MDRETEKQFKAFMASQEQEANDKKFKGGLEAVLVIVAVIVIWRLVAHGIL